MRKILLMLLVLTISIGYASALTVSSINYDTLNPGSQSSLTIKIENDFSQDVKEASLALSTAGTPFSVIGSLQDSVNEIEEDDDESFTFTIKASSSAKPGDYTIPYTLTYELGNTTIKENGNVGLTIKGNPSLEYSAFIENPVIGEQTKINIKIINKGFGDARFLSVRITPQGFLLLSEEKVYVGTVDSDDFETATFDVYTNSPSIIINAEAEYKDFDNKRVVDNVQMPITIYSRERAVELGIIKKSNTGIILLVIAIIIVAWIIWRIIKKRRAKKRLIEGR